MIDEEALKIVLNDKTFSKDEAISIVGGLARFRELCEHGRIRFEKSTSAQNSRWKCNAYDVIRYAQINFRGRKKKSMLHSVNTGMVTAQNVSTV